MNYHVIKGELYVGTVNIYVVTTASTLFIGDTQTVSLSSIYETPPESLILGVTIPLAPVQSTR
jgi:spore germination protein PD